MPYSLHLRILNFDGRLIDVRTIDAILRSPYVPLPVLPNLRELNIIHPSEADALYALSIPRLFFHANLKILRVYGVPSDSVFKNPAHYKFSNFVDDIIVCSADLQSLEITHEGRVDLMIQAEFSKLIVRLSRGLPKLETIQLTEALITPLVVSNLAPSLRLLRSIS